MQALFGVGSAPELAVLPSPPASEQPTGATSSSPRVGVSPPALPPPSPVNRRRLFAAPSQPSAPLPGLAAQQSIVGSLDSLSSSLHASFAVPGEAAKKVVSPNVQMISQLDDTSSTAGRLFTEPTGIPCSLSTFNPLPPDIFSGGAGPRRRVLMADGRGTLAGGGVKTQILGLKFNPWAAAGSALIDASGGTVTVSAELTRLKFSATDGSEVGVSGLQTPITFSLPPPGSLPGGTAGACSFWDAQAGTYSSAGCAAQPNPMPSGHVFSWQTSAGVPSSPAFMPPPPPAPDSGDYDSGLLDSATCTPREIAAPGRSNIAVSSPRSFSAASWTVTGPLACGCTTLVINCTADAAAAAAAAAQALLVGGNATLAANAARVKVYVSPRDVLLFPAISCATGDTTTQMRIFTGETCALWRPGNAQNCYWDSGYQGFRGGGCASASVTQCAVRKLSKRSACSAVQIYALTYAAFYLSCPFRSQCTHLTGARYNV